MPSRSNQDLELFLFFFFFTIWIFFHKHSRITGLQGKVESIPLTPHYYFYPLHRHLDISRAITAENSPLHIASSQARTGNLWFSERKSLTTKLRALENLIFYDVFRRNRSKSIHLNSLQLMKFD